jgi:alpha-N-arabinofuranosidase
VAVTVSASRDESGVVLITLTNQDPNRGRSLEIDLRGMEASEARGRVLTSGAMQDHNSFESPEVVAPAAFDGAHLQGGTLSVELPARSVVALELR